MTDVVMPDECQIHPHDTPESLKPEWIAQPGKKFAGSIMKQNTFRNRCPHDGHAFREPLRYAATMQGQIGDSGALHNSIEALKQRNCHSLCQSRFWRGR